MSALIDPSHQSRDLRTIRAAVRKGWNIPADVMDRLPDIAWQIAQDGQATTRDRMAAMKLLATIKAQNDKLLPPHPKTIRHVHAVEPVTEANFAERKRLLLERAGH